jgi:hypothetical protein
MASTTTTIPPFQAGSSGGGGTVAPGAFDPWTAGSGPGQNPYYTGAAGGTSQDPNANSLPSLPSFAYVSPILSPATWGYTKQNYNNMPLYTGSTDATTISPTKVPALLGKIATVLGLRNQKGMSTAEQIIQALGAKYNINPDFTSGGKSNSNNLKTTEESMLGQIVAQVSGQSIIPGWNNTSKPTNLNDPTAWGHIANALHVSTTDSTSKTNIGTIPWQQAATSILQMPAAQLSQLQGQLYAGGFYDSKASQDPKLIKSGNFDPYTQLAVGNMLQRASEAFQGGKQQTWQDYLTSNLPPGYQAGQSLTDVTGGGVTAKTIPQASEAQLQNPLLTAEMADLGHGMTQAQLDAFTKQYQQMQQAHAGDASQFLDQNNIPTIAGIPSPQAAAQNFAIADDPTAYYGHQISNAMALFQNTLATGSTPPAGTSRPLNSNPNVTHAGRQL